jgi:ketosteroid isomerase-like protein
MSAGSPQQLHELFQKFFDSKDTDGLMTLYEDDAVLVAAPNAAVQGKPAIREALEGFLAMGGRIEFIAESEPILNGKLALTHGRWRLTPDEGDALEGATAEVSRLDDDGVWRYVIDNPWGSGVLDA